jgi:hypothetical protein
MSPEFMRHAERMPAWDGVPDMDVATGRVVRKMCDQIRTGAADLQVQRCAAEAVRQFGKLSGGQDERGIAASCFWWVKHFLTFVHHSVLIYVWMGERDQYQLLIAPEVIVRAPKGKRKGDCAIYTELLGALLTCWGIPWELVTLSVDPGQPGVFSHVYVRAVMSDGRRLNLDSSHGKQPGWKIPARDIMRSQVWDQSGNPIGDAPQFEGLHMYVPTRRGLRGYRGLGDDDSSTTLDYCTLYPAACAGDNPVPTPVTTTVSPSPTPPTPAGAQSNWAQTIANLGKDWTQIASRVIAPSTTYQRNADGSISLVTPGQATIPAALTATAGTASGLLSNPFAWIAGGLGLLLIFKRK